MPAFLRFSSRKWILSLSPKFSLSIWASFCAVSGENLLGLCTHCLLLPQREHVASVQHIVILVQRHWCAHEAAAGRRRRAWRAICFRGVAVVNAGLGQGGAVIKLVPGLEDGRSLDAFAKDRRGRIFHVVNGRRDPVLHGAFQQGREFLLAWRFLRHEVARLGGAEASGRLSHPPDQVVAVAAGRLERRLHGHVEVGVGQARHVGLGARGIWEEMRHDGGYVVVLLLGGGVELELGIVYVWVPSVLGLADRRAAETSTCMRDSPPSISTRHFFLWLEFLRHGRR